MVWDFLTELHHDQRVSDATYVRVRARFGERGVIDLLGIAGHYTFLSMVLNTVRTAVPAGEAASWPALGHDTSGT
jgi:4-carboxymuconolactone decarboxylase